MRLRYAKGESQTMGALKGFGVEVEVELGREAFILQQVLNSSKFNSVAYNS